MYLSRVTILLYLFILMRAYSKILLESVRSRSFYSRRLFPVTNCITIVRTLHRSFIDFLKCTLKEIKNNIKNYTEKKLHTV